MNLSQHFTLAELTQSDAAIRLGIPNKPTPADMANLGRLAQTLEKVREAIRKPIMVTSAYRCEAVNSAIGGAKNSQHMQGLAADIKVPGMTPYEVCMTIMRAGIEYDQLILEFGAWTHISIPAVGNAPRNQELTYRTGKPTAAGIVP